MKYRTIVVDPPWRYTQTPSERTGGGVSAEHIYPTMTTEQIAAIPVGDQADSECHLYLWVTNPVLLGLRPTILGRLTPLDIVTAWGFEPKTILTWSKTSTAEGRPIEGGMGWYFRGATEHVIFGTRGNLGIAADRRVSNLFGAARAGHSAKPDRFYEIVERVSPGPYLELFARRRRYGWDVWGDEAPEQAASQAELGLAG